MGRGKLYSSRVVNIADLRRLAERRAPRVVFDYLDGGAEAEITLRENIRAFEKVTFRPRQAVAFATCDLSVRVLGSEIAIPAILAPVGYSRMMHPGGEVAAARAVAHVLLLQQEDVEVGVRALEVIRGGEPGNAAADDCDVGLEVPIQAQGGIWLG